MATPLLRSDADGLARARAVLAAGGVIAFPTDTVYGLAGNLHDARAVERIYQIKGRLAQMPLIAMVATREAWPQVALALPPVADVLARRWWPGPLTLILPARTDLPARVLGGGATIGVRIPDHPTALALLASAGRPLATTSANRSGGVSPATADAVLAQLDGEIDLVLDAGPTPQGQASTIVDCTQVPPRLLREGPISAAMLIDIIGELAGTNRR